jgi:hypothetical protein
VVTAQAQVPCVISLRTTAFADQLPTCSRFYCHGTVEPLATIFRHLTALARPAGPYLSHNTCCVLIPRAQLRLCVGW